MTNIEYLHERTKNLSAKEMDNLDHMLVGALSVYTDQKTWNHVVEQYVAQILEERNESKRSKTI